MADEIVSHTFSHGYHPDHTARLAAYWAEALGGPTTYSQLYGDETSVVRMHSGNGPHEEMDRPRSLASIRRSPTSASRLTSGSDKCCTTTSRGQRRPRWPATTVRQKTSRKGSESHTGRGTGSSTLAARTTADAGSVTRASARADFVSDAVTHRRAGRASIASRSACATPRAMWSPGLRGGMAVRRGVRCS